MTNFMSLITIIYRRSILCCFALAILTIIFTGCEKDPDPVENNNYKGINEWILGNMQVYYLWNNQIPRSTDKTLFPKDYFESLLYSGDKYSWIQENYIELMKYLSGVATEAGYDFNLFTTNTNNADVYGYITYIKKGSPAETAGLKRGDFFGSINNTQMDTINYRTLLQQTSKQHTIGKVAFTGGTIVKQGNVSLSVVEYEENPILLDAIYQIENKKVGYFVYNFFARDGGDGSIVYEKELNALFGKFKTEKIDELIIDLRYNSGGAVNTATALASMISNRTTKDVFVLEQFNSLLSTEYPKEYGKDYDKTFFIDFLKRYNKEEVVETVAVNKLEGLNRLYLIVTGRSASASELVINGLKPYMDVVLVGEQTEGKNLGSYTIYEIDTEKQKTNSWGLQPIVLKLANAEGFSDYSAGFAPDVEADEFNDFNLMPLGDVDEPMLKAALDHMFGRVRTVKRKSVIKKMKPVGSSADRIPGRKDMYIDLDFERKQHLSK